MVVLTRAVELFRKDISKPPRGFSLFRREAEKMAKDPASFAQTIDAARKKLESNGTFLGQAKGEVSTLLRMIKSYGSGDYRKIPWKALVTGLGSILYFINPLDLIPDFLFGIGLIDDATIFAFCLAALKGELDAFKTWEQSQKISEDKSTLEN